MIAVCMCVFLLPQQSLQFKNLLNASHLGGIINVHIIFACVLPLTRFVAAIKAH